MFYKRFYALNSNPSPIDQGIRVLTTRPWVGFGELLIRKKKWGLF